MKKYFPYIIAILLLSAVIALVVTGTDKNIKRFDDRITLRRNDKIPYGSYIAFEGLKNIFPSASVKINNKRPGYWDSLSDRKSRQALVILTGKFNAEERELKELISFVKNGNDVFISTRSISYDASDIFECQAGISEILDYYSDKNSDSLDLYLSDPPYNEKINFSYPGKRLDATFTLYDASITEILGVDFMGRPNFIRLRAGEGNFYIHLAPLAFSNYFLLHKNNIDYYEKVLSAINPNTETVVWDEYYLNKKSLNENNKRKNWFSVLMNERNSNGDYSFRAAFWLALLLLAVYVLQEMRRKQRFIPVISKPRNDSMEFVKTIGRLYYDKGDHKNLSRKMSAYFLEHVRNKYKILTGNLNEDFVKSLQYKSGAEEGEIREIIGFIKYTEDAPVITEQEVSHFHKLLEAFYKKA